MSIRKLEVPLSRKLRLSDIIVTYAKYDLGFTALEYPPKRKFP